MVPSIPMTDFMFLNLNFKTISSLISVKSKQRNKFSKENFVLSKETSINMKHIIKRRFQVISTFAKPLKCITKNFTRISKARFPSLCVQNKLWSVIGFHQIKVCFLPLLFCETLHENHYLCMFTCSLLPAESIS